MKFCQPHWAKLRAAIEDRGLFALVAKDGEQAAKDLADGRPDPLMSAHNAIVANALQTPAGLAIMMPNEDGSDRCPLCYLASACPCGRPECAATWDTWIDRAANDELERIGATRGQS